MAGSKSNYLENGVLNHVLGGPDFARPASVFIALYTVAPSDIGGGTEVFGGSYNRVTALNDATTWPIAVNGMKRNGVAFVFPFATADWGLIVAFAILDAASGGNILYWGDLTSSKTVESGDTAEFPINGISILED
jgi:hypothetical protein